MTIFEYLAIAYSLVISFAVMRGLSGLPHAASSGRRYSVHLAWVCMNLAAAFQYYWGFWAFRNVEWSQPKFLSVLACPALMYTMACILNPESGSSIASWREYFYQVRVKLFLRQRIELPRVHTGRHHKITGPLRRTFNEKWRLSFQEAFVSQVLALALSLACLASDRPALHATVASLMGAMLLIAAVTVLAPVL